MSFKRKYLKAISHNIFVLNSCSLLYLFVVRMVGKWYVVHRMEHCYCIHGVFSRIAGILFKTYEYLKVLGFSASILSWMESFNWILSLLNIDFLRGEVSWIFLLIVSDRFTALSPNSIDTLLKVIEFLFLLLLHQMAF